MSTRKPRSTAITPALREKARRRRHSSAEQTRAGDVPRYKRNDLRPRLELVDVPIETLRVAGRRIHRHDEAHVAGIVGSVEGCCQVNRAKSKAPYPARNQAAAAAQTDAASTRKRRRVGLLIRWRWMLNVL